jgi:hypothetical protein
VAGDFSRFMVATLDKPVVFGTRRRAGGPQIRPVGRRRLRFVPGPDPALNHPADTAATTFTQR